MTTSNKVRYTEKLWYLNRFGNSPTSKPIKEQLKNELKINDILATLLLNRGIDTKEKAMKFLYGTLDDLHSPFLLKDMEKAVERTKIAIENNETIGFFTDYDADGTTSNALFGLAFRRILNYDNIILHMGDREKDGYGLNNQGLKMLQDKGCSLVITADIGITNYKEAEYCKEIGLDLIITDHHLPKLPADYDENAEDKSQYLPQSLALVNPNRPDCEYPFKGICGCGVAFKFLTALWMELGRDTSELHSLIPIVAIATVADIVPLIDENRIIVKEGLTMMNNPEGTGLVGLDALIKVTGYKHLDADSIGYGLGPRINTCGRLAHAMLASELLTTDDQYFAEKRAKEINDLNATRQEYQREVIEKSFEAITQEYLDNNTMVVLYVPDVHVGVVGIAAGQVTERLYRPSLIVTDHPELEGYLTGSCRSIKDIHVLNVLMSVADAFGDDENTKFGGHSQAAGLTIRKDRFPILQEAIKKYFEKNPVPPNMLKPRILLDKALRVSDIDAKLMEDIDFLAPYGEANPPVKFGFKNVPVKGIKFHKNDALGISIPNGKRDLRGIGFNMHDKAKDLNLQENVAAILDIAFVPAWNEFKGIKTIQIMLEDIRRSHV